MTISQNSLSLTNCDLGRGDLVARVIRHWRKEEPLLKFRLKECLMRQTTRDEVIKYLINCKHLTHLDLSQTYLGKSTDKLAQAMRSWGDEPALKELYLYGCSMPLDSSKELVQSLSACRHLTALDLRENVLVESGKHLALSIRSWGDYPRIEKLLLDNCRIPEIASKEIIQALSKCKLLTTFSFRGNAVGESGHEFAQSIKSWGQEAPIQIVILYDCSMLMSTDLVEAFSRLKHLTVLSLGRNDLHQAGYSLAHTIRSWREGSPLKGLYLQYCLIPIMASAEILQGLSKC